MRGNPRWIAADLVAETEHDPAALAILVTPSRKLAVQVQAAARQVLGELRLKIAEDSFGQSTAIVLTRKLQEAMDLANRLAPEHLMIPGGAKAQLGRSHSAGSIFLGEWSPVAAGYYASGTNHILPTGGGARQPGGLSAADFVKTIAVQRLSRQGLEGMRGAIARLAQAEGMKAHAYSVETRFADAPTA